MANYRWKETMKMLRSHMNPEKEEHLKQISLGNYSSLYPTPPKSSSQYNWRLPANNIIETTTKMKSVLPAYYTAEFGSLRYVPEPQRLRQLDNNVKRILKLAKSINHGNREANLRKKSELIKLVEEFRKQYQSLYSLYSDMKEGIKKNVDVKEEEDSSSSAAASEESDSYYSLDSATPRSGTSQIEDTREVVKEALNVEPVLSSSSKFEELDVHKQMSESRFTREQLPERDDDFLSPFKAHQLLETETLAKMRELEGQVNTLTIELKTMIIQKGQLEDEIGIRDDEVKKISEENLGLRARDSELESILQEKGNEVSVVIHKFNDNEKLLMGKVQNLEAEVNYWRSQKGQLEQSLSENSKGSEQIHVLQQELEKKSQEMSDYFSVVESLREKLETKIADERGIVEERNSLKMQIKDLELEINSLREQNNKNHGTKQPKLDNEKLDEIILQLEVELKEKMNELLTLQTNIEIIGNEKFGEKEDEAELRKAKVVMGIVDETLAELEKLRTGFSERCEHFKTRNSKASSELKFAEDVTQREDEVIKQVKKDVDGLPLQLDEKEEENLRSRQEIMELENKSWS